MVGDYLLSRGLLLTTENKQFELLEIVSRAVKQMSEGELLQMEKARRLDINEEVYYQVIKQKTASLVAACCACGAQSVNMDPDKVELMRQFGENVGLAFQIKDDIFDFGSSDDIGKPTGIDIKERKMTLPLIYTMNNVSKSQKKKIINTIKNYNQDSKRVQEVIEMVIANGGIAYAEKRMIDYKDKAMALIKDFPDNPSKRSMIGLVDYSIARTK